MRIAKISLVLYLSFFMLSCIRPAEEVVIDFEQQIRSEARVLALAEAQFERELLIQASRNTEERLHRQHLARSAERQILLQLDRAERRQFRQEMALRRLQNTQFAAFLQPASIAYFQDLPTITGITVDFPHHFFTVTLILGYDADNRRLQPNIIANRHVIVDRIRNLLMQYPVSAFNQGREEQLREPIRLAINEILGAESIVLIYITRFEVHELPD